MAHLGSKHSAFIDLTAGPGIGPGSSIPSVESLVYHYEPIVIQGNTIAQFALSGLQFDVDEKEALGWKYAGLDELIFEFGDGVQETYNGKYDKRFGTGFTNAGVLSTQVTVLPLTSLEHTYFSTITGSQEISARVTTVYTQTAGESLTQQASALSAVHIIPILQTADNLVDRNLDVLNSQLFTYENNIVPYFNIETDENIIYPVSYYEVIPSIDPKRRHLY